jgi:hypothetical protein
MTPLRQRMLEDLRIRNDSASTVRAYVRCVADFAEHINKSPEKLGPEDVHSYQLFLLNEKCVKLSSCIQSICALRFLYKNTLRRPSAKGIRSDPRLPYRRARRPCGVCGAMR